MDDDPRIASDPVGELAPPDIDRVDPRRSALEQDVAEAPGRGSGVEADEPRRIDPERVQGRRELVPAAADVRIGFDEADRDGSVDEVAGLPVEPSGVAASGPNLAGQDQGLGTRAALGQAAFDDELVETLTAAAHGCLAHGPIVSQPPSPRLNRCRPTEGPAGVGLFKLRASAWWLGLVAVAIGLVVLGFSAHAAGLDPVLAFGVALWGVILAALVTPTTRQALGAGTRPRGPL